MRIRLVFQRRYIRLNWRIITSVPLDRVVAHGDSLTLHDLLEPLTFAKIGLRELAAIPEEWLLKLLRVSQLCLEYLLTVKVLVAFPAPLCPYCAHALSQSTLLNRTAVALDAHRSSRRLVVTHRVAASLTLLPLAVLREADELAHRVHVLEKEMKAIKVCACGRGAAGGKGALVGGARRVESARSSLTLAPSASCDKSLKHWAPTPRCFAFTGARRAHHHRFVADSPFFEPRQ